jgi:hypothetical protein
MGWDDDDDNDWHRSHTNSQGYDVNAFGYDRNGTYRGSSMGTPQNNTSYSRSGRSASTGSTAGGGLVVLGIVGFIVYHFIKTHWVTIITVLGICVICAITCIIIKMKARTSGLKVPFVILSSIGLIVAAIYCGTPRLTLLWQDIAKFFKANQITIVTIIGICIVCAIACSVIREKTKKPGLKTFFVILISIGLVVSVLYFGSKEKDIILDKLRQITTWQTVPQQITTIRETTTAIYANVISDALNVRLGPTVEQEIVGRLTKDTRIEVIDNSGRWWKVKFEDIEGYVDSDFLRSE